jgi:hypothetical protein
MTTEGTGNVLVMNSPLDPDDLLVVDYKKGYTYNNSITQ